MGWADFANTALQVGASLYGSKKASDAAKDAGKEGAAGSEAAVGLQREIYNDQRALNMPFYQGGLSAYNQYLSLLGLPQQQSGADPAQAYLAANPDVARDAYFSSRPQEHYQKYGQQEGRSWGMAPQSAMSQQQAFDAFRNQPGYQFGLDQGTKAIQSSAAAGGGLLSGKTLKALQRYGTDYADQQGFTPYANRLAGLFGGAQTASGAIGGAGQNFAGNAGNAMQNAANSRATGILGAGQAQQQGYQDAAGFLGQYYGKQGGWY